MSEEAKNSAESRVSSFKKAGTKIFFNGVKAVFKAAKNEQKDTDGTKLEAVARKFFPELWNDTACGIQWNNNCYSYACNDPFGHRGKPQPGEKSGKTYRETTVESVTKASIKDGLVKAKLDAEGNPVSKEGYYLVALVVAEGWDYHWYRQDENSKWTHKMGSSLAQQSDVDGKKIDDPRCCNRGRYNQFGGFFYVPNEGLRIGEKARKYRDSNIDDDYKRHLEKLSEKNQAELEKIMAKCGVFTSKEKPANQNRDSIANLVNNSKAR